MKHPLNFIAMLALGLLSASVQAQAPTQSTPQDVPPEAPQMPKKPYVPIYDAETDL